MSPAASRYLPAGISAVPIERLHVNSDNPKAIHSLRFQELKDTIEADPSFLWQRPPLASDGPRHKMQGFVYAGNHRVLAVKALYSEGWRCDLFAPGSIPCDVRDVDEKTCLERLYRDNNEFAEWETDALASNVQWLHSVGANVSLLGFDSEEITALMESTAAAAAQTHASAGAGSAAGASASGADLGPPRHAEEGGDGEEEDESGVDHIGAAEDGPPVVIGIRKLELLYPLEQFREVNDLLAWLCGRYAVETNADAIARRLRDFADAHP